MVYVILITLIVASLLERLITSSMYMPTSLVFWPMAVTLLVASTIGPRFGFIQPKETEVTWIFASLIGFLLGELVAVFLKSGMGRSSMQSAQVMHGFVQSESYFVLVRRVVLFALIAGLLRLALLIRSVGLQYFIATEGLNSVFLTGPIAHIVLVGFSLCPIILCDCLNERRASSGVIWLLYVAMLFSSFIKYHSIFLVLSSVIYCIRMKTIRPQVAIPVAALLSTTVFFSSYAAQFSARGLTGWFTYVIRHYINYLIGSMLYSSIVKGWLMLPGMDPINMLVSTFAALPAKILSMMGVKDVFLFAQNDFPQVPMGMNYETGNACNLISQFGMTGDYVLGIVCIFTLSLIMTLLFFNSKNVCFTSLLASALSLSFFSNYFMLLAVSESLIYSYIAIPLFIKIQDSRMLVVEEQQYNKSLLPMSEKPTRWAAK